jgi:gliding motility-associated-like protein
LGFATINWQQPGDPDSEFTSYQIYRTIDGVNFNLIASLPDYNITSYTDVTADANNGPACYHIRVESFDGNTQLSTPSETLCSLFIDVLQSNPLGLAEITWNDPLNNLDPNWNYQIYLEYPAGVWSIIASVPVSAQNYYEHEVSTCGDWLNFRLEINAGQPCNFVSNIDGDIFTDSTAPPIPLIQSASVDSTSGNAVLTWEPSTAGDTDGYIVYQCISGFTLIVDTVWGASVIEYENLASTADVSGPEFYALAAFDTCYTGNPPSPNTSPTNAVCHSTIFLTASWFACQDHVNLSWTPYGGWPDGVSFYEIYVRTNGNMESLIGTVSTSLTQFVHNGVLPGSSYQYFVKAYSNGSTFDALSNEITVNVLSTTAPDYLYLSTASVVDPSEVELRLFMQSVPGTIEFQLQRQDRFNGEWNDINSQIASNVNFLSFNDYTPDTDWQSYQYRILARDNCGDSIAVSNIAKTIFVTGVGNSQSFVNTLSWNPYLEWDGGVQEYRIYRSIENVETLNFIGTASASNLYFEDDVNSLLLTSGEFCYIVEAVENPNFLGISETSRSNELCILQDPKIWVPNSIIINGFNNEFKPVISFADFDNYQLIVYNRWGDEIFKSNNIEEGWDGSVGGKQVQEGIYLYYISIVDGYGSFHERRGPIYTLIGGKE